MSSIQSLQSYSAQRLLQQSSTSGVGKSDGLPPGLEKRIDSVLSTQNLTDDQRTSLKSDLETAIQSAFDSGSSPPDRSKIDAAVKEVFNKYGLDGDKLAVELRPQHGHGGPHGGGRGGGGGCGCNDSDYDSGSTTKLTDLLQQFLDKYVSESSNSSSTTGTSSITSTDGTAATNTTNSSSSTTSTHDLAQALAQYLSTVAYGLDTQA